MSLSQNVRQTSGAPSKTWQIVLWIAQILLCAMFGMSGAMKTFMSPETLASAGIAWATDVPLWLVRFIGVCELAGAIGIILPALTRIKPFLTPFAALGFAAIQVLAIGFHAIRGEIAMTAPVNALLLGLSLLVLWGRTKKAPIRPRG
jgi:uncharacterized membrane protein YphA (DoxX/SURF4 family)